jgi:ATP-dependent protease ClpP protease subunit
MGLKITNAKGDRATVGLYGVVGDELSGLSAKQFRAELATIPAKTPIDLHIHSEGGDFFDGVAIHNQLKQRHGEVSVFVDSMAASAASIVAMAGKTITMAKHSWMMIHEVHAGGFFYGNVDVWKKLLQDEIPRMESLNEELQDFYSSRWNDSAGDLREAINRETWFTAEETVAAGLADSVGDQLAIAACVDLSKFKYRNAPKALANQEYIIELEKRANFTQ